MKKFLSILLSVILIISICPMGLFGITASAETGNITEFAGGSGTEDDPYLILNKVHLNNVRKYPTACFKLLVDIEYSGNETWQPIENFSGIFDGGNKSITNLKITEKGVEGENSYTGVFAINSGSIKNLNVFDADISNQTENNHNRYVYAGGITGKNTGTIENCSFSGTSYAYTKQIESFWGFAYAGGICGVNSGTIIKCYNIGTIVSESSADNPKSCAGGITAYNTGIISFCYNTGNISSSLIASYDRTSSYYSDAHSGGIVGFMSSQNAYINDCYNIGKIFTHVVSKSTNHIARSMAGGVYGRLESGTVSNCYAIKDIEVIKENGISISSTASNIITKTQNLYYIDRENWQEMLTKSSFLGFDFESIWTFNDNSEYQFPVLKDVQMIFEKKIKSISITQMPSKCIFIKNKDFLDTSNGTITLMYNNFTQEGIPLLNSMVFGYDNTKIGKQTLTVNYLGLVCEYEINIIDHAKNVEFLNVTDVSVTLKKLEGFEYSKDCITWQYDNEFKNLSPATEYTFYQRHAETENNLSGEISDGATITTLKSNVGKPIAPTLFSKTFNVVILNDIYGYEYSKDGINWQISNVFNNLMPNTEYTFYQRSAETDTNYVSEASAGLTVKTDRAMNTTEFKGGNGTDYAPYLISTKEHLNNVRKYPDAYFKQLNDIEFTAADFASGGTYYNNGYGWMPIGKDGNSAFGGNYDGGGYSIKNLKVDITTANSAYGGLFGYCTGDLKNITIENSDIKVTASGYAGGIVGYHTEGTIENCHNNNTTVNAQYSGGIIGYSYYSDLIKDCSNSGKIEGTYIGGIVGAIYATTYYGGTVGAYTDEDADVIGCVNNGEFIKSESSGSYIGGIVGYVKSGTLIVRNCINNGNIYATGFEFSSIIIGGAPVVGGVVGYSYSTDIGNCSNSADIYGDYSGGILGYGNTKIVNSTNTGNISGGKYVGGIVGWHNDGSIYSSVNTGKIVGIRYLNSKIYSNKSDAAGGIVGAARNGSGIYECSNLGDVSNGTYSGGIVGIGDYVSQCYNNGKVTSIDYSGGICADFLDSYSKIWDCYNTGNISGKYAAGLLANMEYGMVLTSYSVGKISATESGGYIAAIVAYQTGGTVTDCYYLDNINIGVGYVDYSISNTPETIKLNKENMQNPSNFDGFDFDAIWTMDGNTDYPYPELQNVEMLYVPYVLGDIDGVEGVTDRDAVYLLYHTFLSDIYPVNQDCDFNGDGEVNDKDAVYLLYHTFLPDLYPIN